MIHFIVLTYSLTHASTQTPAFMHPVIKVKAVNRSSPVCEEESWSEKGLQRGQVWSFCVGSSGFCCMFLARQHRFLLLKLFSVRCWWAKGGRACGRKEKAQKGRGEGGREDDGTGVEFTHPAGSEHYWHVCLAMMSHPILPWNFVGENVGDTQCEV